MLNAFPLATESMLHARLLVPVTITVSKDRVLRTRIYSFIKNLSSEKNRTGCETRELDCSMNSCQGCPCEPLSQYCWYYLPIRFWLINPKVSSVTNFRQFDYIWAPNGEELNSIQWFRLVFELESHWLTNEPIEFEHQIENH